MAESLVSVAFVRSALSNQPQLTASERCDGFGQVSNHVRTNMTPKLIPRIAPVRSPAACTLHEVSKRIVHTLLLCVPKRAVVEWDAILQISFRIAVKEPG